MGKHKPNVIWGFRKSNMRSHIRTLDRSTVEINLGEPDIIDGFEGPVGSHTVTLVMNRRSAALLARRINQMLESTK